MAAGATDPWYRGRAIVIGDAAHACPPLIAQGAAMCAEDAVVLAELVTGDRPLEQALPAFMARRMPRVELVVRNSMRLVRWEMGLEPHTEADVARGHELDPRLPRRGGAMTDEPGDSAPGALPGPPGP